jgi:hypothetical protein
MYCLWSQVRAHIRPLHLNSMETSDTDSERYCIGVICRSGTWSNILSSDIKFTNSYTHRALFPEENYQDEDVGSKYIDYMHYIPGCIWVLEIFLRIDEFVDSVFVQSKKLLPWWHDHSNYFITAHTTILLDLALKTLHRGYSSEADTLLDWIVSFFFPNAYKANMPF